MRSSACSLFLQFSGFVCPPLPSLSLLSKFPVNITFIFMWKQTPPPRVVCIQSAVLLLSFKGDSSYVWAPLTPGSPLFGSTRGDLCAVIKGTADGAVTPGCWHQLTQPSPGGLSLRERGGNTERGAQWDNWTDFRDTGAQSAAWRASVCNLCHLECSANSPLTSASVSVGKAYGVSAVISTFPRRPPSTQASWWLKSLTAAQSRHIFSPPSSKFIRSIRLKLVST